MTVDDTEERSVPEASFATPVLVIAFRRPDLTRMLMEAIAAVRPRHLVLACDGARPDVEGEEELVAETRRVLDAAVTWPCEVERLYHDENLGCRRAVQAGIDRLFERFEEGIILEDDCIPHPDFFPYCEELLDRYRDDERVLHISGDGSMPSLRSLRAQSYVFTHHAAIWGWATWRRAWQRYDRGLAGWRAIREDPEKVAAVYPHEQQRAWWTRKLDSIARGNDAHVWDFQWMFTVRNAGGFAVLPTSNLITNLGFRPDGTNVVDPADARAGVPLEPMPTIVHPAEVAVDPRLDWRVQCEERAANGRHDWGHSPSLVARVRARARAMLGRAAHTLGLRAQ